MIAVAARFPICLVALLAAGCAANLHRYRYQPPTPIATPDWQGCHARADATAQQRYDRYVEIVEAAGPFGGPFGGMTLAQQAWSDREATYAREMEECLAARGYEVRAPGPEHDSR